MHGFLTTYTVVQRVLEPVSKSDHDIIRICLQFIIINIIIKRVYIHIPREIIKKKKNLYFNKFIMENALFFR